MTLVAAALTGGTFQRILDASNGVDDSTWLNLALAGGGFFRGKPGETYKISTALVLRSNTTLDMTGCTVQCVATSPVNMVTNYARTNILAINEDVSMTSGSNIATVVGPDVTQGTYAVGQTVVMDGALGSGTVIIPLVATITAISGTQITLDKTASTTTPTWALTAYARDSNITIRGGKWDRGTSGGVGQGTIGHSFLFRFVDGLDVDIDQFISTTAAGYAMSVGAVTNYRLGIGSVSSGLDGIHIMGPAYNGEVTRICGTTHDDSVSLTGSDYAGGLTDVAGDITGFRFGVINTTAGQSNLKILAGFNCKIDGVVGGLIQGTATSHCVWVGEDTGNGGTKGGTYGTIDVGTIIATTSTTGKYQLFLASPVADRIKARQVLTRTSGYATGVAQGGTQAASAGTVDRLELDLDVTGPAGMVEVKSNSGGTIIKRLVLDGRYVQTSGSGAACVLNSQVNLLDARLDATLTGSLASGPKRVLSGTTGVDVSALTPADGDITVNSNAALGCGSGRVIYNSAAGKWKHLYTGLTT